MMFDDYMNERQIELDVLESRLESTLKQIAEISFKLNSHDFDFYNETNYYANFLRTMANDLQEVNDDICDILDYYFDATGEYPDTKYYGK